MNLKKVIDRAKTLLLHPKNGWTEIEKEGRDVKDIINYVAVISLVPALALFIGYSFVGLPTAYGYFRMSLTSAFFLAVVFYFLSGVAVGVTALMISFFANYFSIIGRFEDYLKLAAYSATAPILANVFYLIPMLKFLKIVGFYGCVTLFVGLPMLIKAPKEKEMQFVVTILISAIVIAIIFFSLTDQFIGPLYSEVL